MGWGGVWAPQLSAEHIRGFGSFHLPGMLGTGCHYGALHEPPRQPPAPQTVPLQRAPCLPKPAANPSAAPHSPPNPAWGPVQALAAADYVVEAVPEREALKTEVFRALDRLLPPHAVLASNTSSISITRLAAATSRPDRVVGLHFMNPVWWVGVGVGVGVWRWERGMQGAAAGPHARPCCTNNQPPAQPTGCSYA